MIKEGMWVVLREYTPTRQYNGKRRIVGYFEGIHTNQAVHSTAAPDKLSTASIKNIVRKRARRHLGQTNHPFKVLDLFRSFQVLILPQADRE